MRHYVSCLLTFLCVLFLLTFFIPSLYAGGGGGNGGGGCSDNNCYVCVTNNVGLDWKTVRFRLYKGVFASVFGSGNHELRKGQRKCIGKNTDGLTLEVDQIHGDGWWEQIKISGVCCDEDFSVTEKDDNSSGTCGTT
ncbi:MAG: hypothetical protein HQ589_08615 [Syntrophaceae bacterium]|nr:hypothetical protein [Syntrophaceae bacterium]